jgi:hypothetical protein
LNRTDFFHTREGLLASSFIFVFAEAEKAPCLRKPEIQRYTPKGMYLFLLSDFTALVAMFSGVSGRTGVAKLTVEIASFLPSAFHFWRNI